MQASAWLHIMRNRKARKFCAVLITVLLLIGTVSSVYADNSYSFTYKTSGGRKELTGYTGTLPAEIEIPEGVTDIGMLAFDSCKNLKKVVLPDTVTRIGMGAFGHCENLETLHIPDSVTILENSALYADTKLSDLTLGSGLLYIDPYALCGVAATSLTVPDGVKTISSGAFSQCTQLQSISLPPDLESIEQNAFYLCWALSDLEFRGSVRTIGYRAFYDCKSLRNVVLPEGCEKLDDYCFSFCSALNTIYIPGTLKYLGINAFEVNNSLSHILFGGTSEQWANLTRQATGIPSYTKIDCNAVPPHTAAPGFPQPVKENGWIIAQHANGLIMTGITASASQHGVTAGEIISSFDLPEGKHIEIRTHDGVLCQPDQVAATGDQFELTSTTGQREPVTIIVRGDILGTGRLDIAQLVRMAQVLNGQAEISWPYELAGALTGTGSINIADLAAEAALLRGE